METEDARLVPEGRTLEGWTRLLPTYLVEAIAEGIASGAATGGRGPIEPALRGSRQRVALTVKQGKGYQYLVGNVVNPQGTLVSFLE